MLRSPLRIMDGDDVASEGASNLDKGVYIHSLAFVTAGCYYVLGVRPSFATSQPEHKHSP